MFMLMFSKYGEAIVMHRGILASGVAEGDKVPSLTDKLEKKIRQNWDEMGKE